MPYYSVVCCNSWYHINIYMTWTNQLIFLSPNYLYNIQEFCEGDRYVYTYKINNTFYM